MNGRALIDAQISTALRAHLPNRAQAGLRERILEAAETTAQQRALPSFLGALSAADPVTRRRILLIAAALLVALALASVAAVGALRLLERDLVRVPSPEPSREVPFVISGPTSGPGLIPVEPGAYRMREPGESPTGWPSTVIVTIPEHWQAVSATRGAGLVRTDDIPLSSLNFSRMASLNFSIVGNLVADPCTNKVAEFPLEPPVGRSVDDLAAGLRSLPTLEFTEPVEVTLDGWEGKRMEVTPPAGCGDAALWLTPPRIWGNRGISTVEEAGTARSGSSTSRDSVSSSSPPTSLTHLPRCRWSFSGWSTPSTLSREDWPCRSRNSSRISFVVASEL